MEILSPSAAPGGRLPGLGGNPRTWLPGPQHASFLGRLRRAHVAGASGFSCSHPCRPGLHLGASSSGNPGRLSSSVEETRTPASISACRLACLACRCLARRSRCISRRAQLFGKTCDRLGLTRDLFPHAHEHRAGELEPASISRHELDIALYDFEIALCPYTLLLV